MGIGFLAFVATNVDDLLVLVLLFLRTDLKKRHIVLGQYLGFVVIMVMSSLGSLGKWIVPLKWIGLLGLVPILLGIREMRRLLWKQKLSYEMLHLPPDISPSFVRIVFGTAAITVGNGSDNVATYIPLFADGDLTHMGILIGFFLLLLGLWCYIGYALARLAANTIRVESGKWSSDQRANSDSISTHLYLLSLPPIAAITEQFGHILLLFVFIALGIIILIKTGALVLLWTFLF